MSKARQIETQSERCRIVLVRLNSGRHLNLLNLVISRQKIFSSKRKDEQGESLPILAERLESELWKATKYFQTAYVYSSIGSEGTACKTPPKQRINVSKRLLETPSGSSPCHESVRVNRLCGSFS